MVAMSNRNCSSRVWKSIQADTGNPRVISCSILVRSHSRTSRFRRTWDGKSRASTNFKNRQILSIRANTRGLNSRIAPADPFVTTARIMLSVRFRNTRRLCVISSHSSRPRASSEKVSSAERRPLKRSWLKPVSLWPKLSTHLPLRLKRVTCCIRKF